MSDGRAARCVLVAALLPPCLACQLIFPFSTDTPDGSSTSDASCLEASSRCWDAYGKFEATDFEAYPPQIFGTTASDGVAVYALLDGTTDSTYQTYTVLCPVQDTGAQTWHIERAIEGQAYRLRVRGTSAEDCSRGQPVCRGEIGIDLQRGWTMPESPTDRCVVTADILESNGTLIETYCNVDRALGRVTWQAGSACGGCCRCPDGAGVDIDVEVSRE